MPRARKTAPPETDPIDLDPREPPIVELAPTLPVDPPEVRKRGPKIPGHTTGTALAVRGLMRRAQEAQRDLPAFYEFTIKHEITKAPLKIAPHQTLMFRFAIDHPHCVIRMPIGCGKTFGMSAMALWLLGQDVTARGAIVSKIQGQAEKPLHMVADYITEPTLNPPLIMVFPWLQKGTRPTDEWTQTAITVQRPPAIRDPSIVAAGLDTAIGGSRLSWLVGDDILDADNTLTPAAREKVHSNFDARILSRLDPIGSCAVVCNTPWNLDDLTYNLEAAGWPTISMDIYGNIWFAGVSEEWLESVSDLIRRSNLEPGCYRLRAHDPDASESTPLWPERYSLETINDIRAKRLPHEFARLFLCKPFDEEAACCQKEWIETCKARGRGLRLVHRYSGPNPVYTGVDLGVGKQHKHDLTSLFTFELLPNGDRRILNIETGRWTGPVIVDKLIDAHDRYGSIVGVESNAAQDYIRQFAKEDRADLRVRAHTTGQANKQSIDFGVESIFTEIKAGKWIIPCDEDGSCAREVQAWIEGCLYYQPPPHHTNDRLMACWIAREASRRGGGGRDPKPKIGLRLQLARGGGF